MSSARRTRAQGLPGGAWAHWSASQRRGGGGMAGNLAGGGRTWSARPLTYSPRSHESNGGVGGVIGSSDRAGGDGLRWLLAGVGGEEVPVAVFGGA